MFRPLFHCFVDFLEQLAGLKALLAGKTLNRKPYMNKNELTDFYINKVNSDLLLKTSVINARHILTPNFQYLAVHAHLNDPATVYEQCTKTTIKKTTKAPRGGALATLYICSLD